MKCPLLLVTIVLPGESLKEDALSAIHKVGVACSIELSIGNELSPAFKTRSRDSSLPFRTLASLRLFVFVEHR